VADEKETGYERLGGKKLSLVDVVAQSVGFMGPVFSAAFVIPLIVGVISATGKGAGVATPLAVLVAAIGVFALGWIVATYARKIHAAGSLYDYVTIGLGGNVGGAAGWLYYSGTIALTAGLIVLMGGYIHDTLDGEFHHPIMSGTLWSLVVSLLIFVVLYLGVQLSTRVQLTLSLVSVVVVLAFFIKVIIDLGSKNDFAKTLNPSSSSTGWSGVLFGVLYGVLIFVGFETAANLSEEAADPKRMIPRAVITSVIVVSIFYLIASYAQVAGFNFDLKTIASAASAPLFALASPASAGGYGSIALVRLMELVVLLDMIAVAVGAAVASTRGTFAIARDRRLPAALATTSKRFGTPSGAIIFLTVLNVLLVAANQWWTGLFALPETPHYFAIFSWMSTYGAFALVVVYFLMSVGSLRGIDGRVTAGMIVAAILGLAISVGAIYGSIYQVPSPTKWAPYFAIALFVIGLLITFAVKGREPASRVLADLHSEGAGTATG
jgi:amino acid transporter